MKPIAGKLVSPGNVAIPNATVRFIAVTNTVPGCFVNGVLDNSIIESACTGVGKVWVSGALKGTMFAFTTNGTGDYSTNVLAGSYKVEFKNQYRNKFVTFGRVTISSTDTTSEPLEDIGIS
jgi:hypothetical protein